MGNAVLILSRPRQFQAFTEGLQRLVARSCTHNRSKHAQAAYHFALVVVRPHDCQSLLG